MIVAVIPHFAYSHVCSFCSSIRMWYNKVKPDFITVPYQRDDVKWLMVAGWFIAVYHTTCNRTLGLWVITRYKNLLPIIYRCGLVLLHLNIQELGYALMQPRISQLPDPFKDDITYLSVPIKNVFFHCKLLTSICNVDYIPMNSSLYDYIMYIYIPYFPITSPLNPHCQTYLSP